MKCLLILLTCLAFVQPIFAMRAEDSYPTIREAVGMSQQGLIAFGEVTYYGCAPTAVAYALQYWHSVNPVNRVASAQDLLDANIRQGKFDNGMSLTDLHDEVQDLGYIAIDFKGIWDGTYPYLAVVDMFGGHVVVVKSVLSGIVTFCDPWDGRIKTYSIPQFDAIYSCNCGMVIKPIYGQLTQAPETRNRNLFRSVR